MKRIIKQKLKRELRKASEQMEEMEGEAGRRGREETYRWGEGRNEGDL